MSIVLLWRHSTSESGALEPGQVASNLQKVFAPLFKNPLRQRIFQSPGMAMVVLELPTPGWRPPFFQADQESWAFAGDCPINGRTVLSARGTSFSEDNFLPVLCRKLQHDPRLLLQDLAPPFSLVWSSKTGDETFVQNDGLGMAPLFEFQDDRLWALSNKIPAFKALGVSLEPTPEQWAVWATLGWFPMEMSGYRNIRFLEPATQLRLTAQGISNVTGQHGEIGRRERMFSDEYQPEKIGAPQFSDQQYEDYIVGELIKDMPPFTRSDIQELVRDTIRKSFRQADRYDLKGLARVATAPNWQQPKGRRIVSRN